MEKCDRKKRDHFTSVSRKKYQEENKLSDLKQRQTKSRKQSQGVKTKSILCRGDFFKQWKIGKKHHIINLSHGIKITINFYEIFNILICVLIFDFLITFRA